MCCQLEVFFFCCCAQLPLLFMSLVADHNRAQHGTRAWFFCWSFATRETLGERNPFDDQAESLQPKIDRLAR